MPRAKNAKIWNDDLIRACEARRTDASARGSHSEFQWVNAKRLIEGTSKEIYITQSSDSVKNLPDGATRVSTSPPLPPCLPPSPLSLSLASPLTDVCRSHQQV